MKIRLSIIHEIAVVEVEGELTSNTAPQARDEILSRVEPYSKVILNMGPVPYMSSAGLRVLLLVYRAITGKGGQVILVGLSEDLRATMAVTGFLDFFNHHDTLDAGLAALA